MSDAENSATRRRAGRIIARITQRITASLERIGSFIVKRVEDKQRAILTQRERVTIWDWLLEARADNSVLVVIGPPGSGKTTLLKHVAITLAKRGRSARGHRTVSKIPVLIALRDHKDKFSNSQKDPTLADLIRDDLRDVQRKEPPQWIETQLERGRLIIMLDGLDEVATGHTRKRISDWIEKQRQAFPDTLFVVTSRPFGYKSAPLNSAVIVQVQPFAERQVKKFVESWYETTSIRAYGDRSEAAILNAKKSAYDLLGKLRESPNLLGLTVNPLLLTMVANVHHYRGALPGSRVELYKEICEVLLGKRHQARGVDLELSVPQKQAVLQELAYRMMVEDTRDVTPGNAKAWISEVLSRVAPHVTVLEFMLHVEESSGLIVEREHQTYTFAHLTFQEYLASVYIRENQLIDILLTNVHSSWWRETILLFAAQADATPIVQRCLKDISDFSLLSLATQCSEEGREISLQARHALTQFLEGDVRTHPERRKAAAAVKLFRRLQEFVRVGEDEYVSRQPITCLEYQLFIDETTVYDPAVPDHWEDLVFAARSDNAPVMGVRTSDANRFCTWLRDLYGTEWYYQFPKVEHINQLLLSAPMDSNIPSALPALHEWTLGAASAHERGRVRAIVVVTAEGFEIPVEALVDQIDRDQQRALQCLTRAGEGSSVGPYIRDDCGLDLNTILQIDLLQGILEGTSTDRQQLLDTLRNVKSVDLGRAAEVGEAIAQNILSMYSSGKLVGSYGAALAALSQALNYGMAICFNRSASPSLRLIGSSNERFYSRLTAAAAAAACRKAVLESSLTDHDQSSRYLSRLSYLLKETLIRRSRRTGLSKRALDPTKGMEWIESELRKLYCVLALFELRIAAELPAWEGLYISRRRNLIDTDLGRGEPMTDDDRDVILLVDGFF